jgi:hypothetical protein
LPSKNWKSDAQILEWIILNILMSFKWLAMNYLVFLFNYHFTFFLLSCYMMGLTMMFCVFLIFRCLFTWMDGEMGLPEMNTLSNIYSHQFVTRKHTSLDERCIAASCMRKWVSGDLAPWWQKWPVFPFFCVCGQDDDTHDVIIKACLI